MDMNFDRSEGDRKLLAGFVFYFHNIYVGIHWGSIK